MNKHRRIRITSPREIYRRILMAWPLFSPRFAENLPIVALNRGGRSSAEIDRRVWLSLYYAGFLHLKPLLRSAIRTLDEKNLGILVRSLAREMNGNKKAIPNIDVVICYLHDAETLAHCSDREASARVSSYLHEQGVPYKLRPDAYRKRVERLRHKGVKLGLDKQ